VQTNVFVVQHTAITRFVTQKPSKSLSIFTNLLAHVLPVVVNTHLSQVVHKF